MKTLNKSLACKVGLLFSLVVSLGFLLGFTTMPASAAVVDVGTVTLAEPAGKDNVGNDTKAQNELRAYTLKQLSGNNYEQQGGGSISGVDMFENDQSGQIQVSEDQWNKLDKKGQKDFSADLHNAVNQATNANSKEQITQNTQDVTVDTSDNWLKELSNMNGWGSEFMSNVLANSAKPNWQSAAAIIRPFSGVLGTITACIVILLMGCLGVTIAIDIFYIMIPFAGGLASEGKSRWVSREAMAAVSQSDGGEKKRSVIFTYLKSRIFGLFFLCLTIELLITNQLFPLIARLMNLTSGLLGILT